jgi:transposase
MEDGWMKPVANSEDGVRRVIDNEMWDVLAAIISDVCDRRGRKPELEVREFVEAVFYWGRTGVQWRDMPTCFGKWDAVYNRWRRWEQNGYWKKIWHALHAAAPERAEELFVDSTVIRAHQHSSGGDIDAAERATGRSRGGVGTKIHVIAADAKTALAVTVTAGQAHDAPEFESVMMELPEHTAATAVVADRAYDSNAIREDLEDAGFEVVIPSRSNRNAPKAYDLAKYKLRNQAERLINRLKRLRRLATRYEKLACTYLALVHVGCILSILA